MGRLTTVRQGLAGSLLAIVTGAVLGYLALFLREIGWLLGAGVALALGTFYVRARRGADLGWLLVGAGAIPALVLGSNAIQAKLEPSIEVGRDTWIMAGVGVAVVLTGLVVLTVSRVRRD